VASQARTVAAGALDTDQGDRAEPAQPAQQAGVPGRGGREFPHAEQASERIQRGGYVHVGVGVHATGDGVRVFYDGHCRPFSGLCREFCDRGYAGCKMTRLRIL
jgi:hypothetical protein